MKDDYNIIIEAISEKKKADVRITGKTVEE